jgi:uncharacterized protein
MRFVTVLSSSLLLATAVTAAPRPPAGVGPVRVASPAEKDSLLAAYAKDRADTEKHLKEGATSYLAAVGRTDFADKSSLVVGSHPECDVVLDAEASPHHLRVTVDGDSFHIQAIDDTAAFAVRGERLREARMGPGTIRLGRYSVRLSHQRFPAIIVFDPKSAHFSRYHGLEWYPADLAYRFAVPLTPNPEPDTTTIMSTRGNQRRAVLAGWFDLRVKGKPVRLEAHRLLEPGVDESSVSIFFRDATSGTETYPIGRYIDPERLPNGDWLVDFNNAYNPACAVSHYYNCPIPSKANNLRVAIRAGEKDADYVHD